MDRLTVNKDVSEMGIIHGGRSGFFTMDKSDNCKAGREQHSEGRAHGNFWADALRKAEGGNGK